MKKTLAIVVCALPVLVCAQADPLQQEWDKAKRLDSLEKYEQAVRVLDELVTKPSWEYRARMFRSGILLDDLGRASDAFADLSAAMQLCPDSVAPYLNRSSFYLRAGMADRAIGDLEQGLARCRNAEDSVSMYVNMGAAFGQVRRFEEALVAFDRALVLEPGSWSTLSNKAATLDDLGRADEAKAIYIRLHEQKPEELVILNNLGFLTSNQGQHGEAIGWFEKALVLAPGDPFVLNNLGYAQLQAGRTDEALRNVQRSIERMPSNSYAHRNLGLVWKEKKQVDKACDAFEEALRLGFTKQYGPEVEEWRRSLCH